jgi:hypothetical protein
MHASQRWPFRVAMTLLGRCVAVRGPLARASSNGDDGHSPERSRHDRPNSAAHFAAQNLGGSRTQGAPVDAAERFHP